MPYCHTIILATTAGLGYGVLDLLTLGSFGDGEDDTGNESFTVVRLLEDLDLLSKTRAVASLARGPYVIALEASLGLIYVRSGLLVTEGLELDGLDTHDEVFIEYKMEGLDMPEITWAGYLGG